MRADTIQTSFAAGEIGPSLLGRVDIAQYANACALVQNMLPRSYGPVISMPGTRYVATVSDSTLRTRLIKFVFNRRDAYVIEMGDLYMRFYTNRGQVVNSAAAGTETLTAFGTDVKAHWKCNDNAATTTVTDDKATHGGTSSTVTSSLSTTAIVSTGFDLDGLYHISVTDHDNFTRTSSSQPMSIAGWFYYVSNGARQTLCAKWEIGSEREYFWEVNSDDRIRFSVFDESSDGQKLWTTANALTTGWHFLVVVFKGDGTAAGDVNMYVDTTIQSLTYSEVASGFVAMENRTSNFYIGATGSSAFYKWADKIDNIAFFHKELVQTDINSLYTESAYQLTTVFTADEVFDVHYTQLNDVIWLAHPNHPVQKLVRTASDSWTISDAPIVGGPFLDDNTPVLTSASVSASSITITASATTGTVNLTVSPTNASLFTVSAGTLGHQGSYWAIGGLAQTNVTTELKERGYCRITNVVNSYTATATVIKNLVASTAQSIWAEGAWSAVRGYPGRVVLQGNRLWFARSNAEPQKQWGSRIFDYEDFALDTEADDDGLNVNLSSNESNEIQWLAAGKSLIAGTFGGAFITSSGSSDALTPDNIVASEEVGFGSNSVIPKKVGQFLYYVQRFGKKLRELFYNWEMDTYKALDRTILSPHILGDGVVDMDVATTPETILYCVLTAGTLATMTRETDQEVTAWAKHTTDGTYTSIAIIPSQTSPYDEAWVIVERWIGGAQKKYVEYFETMEVPSRQDQSFYVHSGLSYDAYDVTSQSATTISLSASTGSVTLTSSTGYFNGGMVNKRLRAINAAGTTIGEGTITATASTTSITLSITTTFNALSYAAGRWGVSVSTISGLSHLDAKTLSILADGLTESTTRTVASGAVTLGSNYFVIQAGLGYTQALQTLPKENGTERGTAQSKWQRYNEIAFRVNNSTQDFKYGQDADNLDDVQLAFTPTVTTLYTGILPPQGGGLTMRGGYHRGARIYVQHTKPLPLEILNIIGYLDTYDK